ncbi:GGDEF domain-containing protein [Pseudorhodoferax sp. Leaf267]|uniref:GGDEF domain-containing protein n=1 Tax=Pseudorhodoferax sp. Leaf267 TaxID=1736316 RepID=UPI0012E1D902|nr:GGDEF domain-containing protein [Pseudorhodoferax sp. Leaf267]
MQIHKPRSQPPQDDGVLAGAGASTAPFHWLQAGLLVACVVTLASLFGVWTRLAGQLAVFWPANALLLGVLLRFPRLDTASGWIGGAAGYMVGGWIAGDGLAALVLLTLGNFLSVVTGYLLLARLGPDDRRLAKPASVLMLVWVIFLSAGASGLGGTLIGPLVFNSPAIESGMAWFVSEVVNYIAILPAVLTIPVRRLARPVPRQWRAGHGRHLRRALPLASLAVSLGLALVVGGPGAIAFPVPALLWCGMAYGLFGTSVLTLLTTTWMLLAISKGQLDMSVQVDTPQMLMSVRLGVTLIALSPIAVASAMATHTALTRRLRHMAEHDPLTGTMNRRAFSDHAGQALRQARIARAPAGLLILDIDHFKSVNDSYGHAAGDLVIVHIANCLRRHLPEGPPLLGRLGGEEFAVLLPYCTRQQTLEIAERMRQACAETAVDIGDGRLVTATASIGACVALPAIEQLDQMLQCADGALYQAKHDGRNRVILAEWVASVER